MAAGMSSEAPRRRRQILRRQSSGVRYDQLVALRAAQHFAARAVLDCVAYESVLLGLMGGEWLYRRSRGLA